MPLLWVLGTRDPFYSRGSAYAFDKAPPDPRSRDLVVEADHRETPKAAEAAALAWIREWVR